LYNSYITSISYLEKEILAIKNRNKKVEIDKAWETGQDLAKILSKVKFI